MSAPILEIIVREIAAGDPRCPYNEEACRTMPIDREYMRDSGYGKTGAAILSALAAAGYAVVPVEPTEAMRKAFWAAGYHQGDAFGQGYPAMLAAAKEPQA